MATVTIATVNNKGRQPSENQDLQKSKERAVTRTVAHVDEDETAVTISVRYLMRYQGWQEPFSPLQVRNSLV